MEKEYTNVQHSSWLMAQCDGVILRGKFNTHKQTLEGSQQHNT
jgi:hypothetical protein